MADEKPVSSEVDASGRLVDRRVINGLKPDLKFAPEELPSNPVARAAFPKELVDENLAVTPYEGAGSFPKGKLTDLEKQFLADLDKVKADAASEVAKVKEDVKSLEEKLESKVKPAPAEKVEEAPEA